MGGTSQSRLFPTTVGALQTHQWVSLRPPLTSFHVQYQQSDSCDNPHSVTTTVSTRCQSNCPTKYLRVEDILCYIFPFVTLVRGSAGPPAEMLYLPSPCPQNMSSQHSLGIASEQFFLLKNLIISHSLGFTIPTQETPNRLYRHQSYILKVLNLNPRGGHQTFKALS